MSAAAAAAGQAQDPYKDARKEPTVFTGPGREAPDPPGLTEVRIGWFGPAEGPMWNAASMALEEVNQSGGYKGLPFRLLTGWAADPWRAGAANLTRMVFRDRAWAVIAAFNGDATHLAEQVVAKALLPLLNPVATDRTIHGAGVPWMFSCVQGDHQLAPLLAEAVKGRTKVVLVSATDHDSRAFLAQLKPLVRFAAQVEFEPGRAETAAQAAALQPDAVVLIAGARDSAAAVKALRGTGYRGPIAGGPWLGRAEFQAEAGQAGGVSYPALGEAAPAFREAYRKRFGAEPDYAAACAYDSVMLIAGAARRAGLNRSRLRDALEQLSPYPGVSGRIEWDEFGQNRRAPQLRRAPE